MNAAFFLRRFFVFAEKVPRIADSGAYKSRVSQIAAFWGGGAYLRAAMSAEWLPYALQRDYFAAVCSNGGSIRRAKSTEGASAPYPYVL